MRPSCQPLTLSVNRFAETVLSLVLDLTSASFWVNPQQWAPRGPLASDRADLDAACEPYAGERGPFRSLAQLHGAERSPA